VYASGPRSSRSYNAYADADEVDEEPGIKKSGGVAGANTDIEEEVEVDVDVENGADAELAGMQCMLAKELIALGLDDNNDNDS
jgi:hypothetical protein